MLNIHLKKLNKPNDTHREQTKERVLKHLTLLVPVCNERDFDLAEVLGEEKDKKYCPAKEKEKLKKDVLVMR